MAGLLSEHDIDTFVHSAAESHVDRSIAGPAPFITTNLVGTFTWLEAPRHVCGLPVTGTKCSNNYGPFQHGEKFIPTVIRSCLAGQRIPVYGTGMNLRDWLYVEDHCRAVECVVRSGVLGQIYLVGARNERRNLDIARLICRLLAGATGHAADYYLDLIELVADRPGHDFRYAVDPSRLERELGWRPVESFETGLRRTIDWYLANRVLLEVPH